jgi:hypothetical protein
MPAPRRITVSLPEDTLSRLVELARNEYRDPRAQAAALIADGLRRAERELARSEKAETRR